VFVKPTLNQEGDTMGNPNRRYLDRIGVEVISEEPLVLTCLLCDYQWAPATERGKVRRGELLCRAARERGGWPLKSESASAVKAWSRVAWLELSS
jgi:hypothetical protein